MCKRVIWEHKVFSCWASSVKETYSRFWLTYMSLRQWRRSVFNIEISARYCIKQISKFRTKNHLYTPYLRIRCLFFNDKKIHSKQPKKNKSSIEKEISAPVTPFLEGFDQAIDPCLSRSRIIALIIPTRPHLIAWLEKI